MLICILTLLAAPSVAQVGGEQMTIAPRSRQEMAILYGSAIATDWLGGRTTKSGPDLNVTDPLLQTLGSMFVEQQLAERVIRNWWPLQAGDAKADAMLDGFSVYLATRAIEAQFDVVFRRTSHSFESQKFLGAHAI